MPEGAVAENVRLAKHILFCVGTHPPNQQILAVPPRSIAFVDQGHRFVISFLEAPMPLANNAMEGWVKAIVDDIEPVAA